MPLPMQVLPTMPTSWPHTRAAQKCEGIFCEALKPCCWNATSLVIYMNRTKQGPCCVTAHIPSHAGGPSDNTLAGNIHLKCSSGEDFVAASYTSIFFIRSRPGNWPEFNHSGPVFIWHMMPSSPSRELELLLRSVGEGSMECRSQSLFAPQFSELSKTQLQRGPSQHVSEYIPSICVLNLLCKPSSSDMIK